MGQSRIPLLLIGHSVHLHNAGLVLLISMTLSDIEFHLCESKDVLMAQSLCRGSSDGTGRHRGKSQGEIEKIEAVGGQETLLKAFLCHV